MQKKWYLSRTLYLNIIGVAVILFGADKVTPEISGIVLGIINFVMRLITKEELVG